VPSGVSSQSTGIAITVACLIVKSAKNAWHEFESDGQLSWEFDEARQWYHIANATM
jgi:hypothetical protein